MNVAPLKGLGVWIVNARAVEGGLVPAIAARCRRSGISWLAIRSGGTDSYGLVTRPLVERLQGDGIDVVSWNYSVPGAQETARQVAHVQQMLAIGVRGHIIDAEIEWETRAVPGAAIVADRRPEAADFMRRLRAAVGADAWIAHAPWWLPSAHPIWPWAEFGAATDAQMPQVYWTMRPVGQSARDMISRGEDDWAKLADAHPEAVSLRAPIGSTFHGTPANGVHDGQPFLERDGDSFLDTCELDPTLPFWSLYSYDAMPPEGWAMLERRAKRGPLTPPAA
jgi:hypothetical protein